MRYCSHRPATPLGDFVDCFWESSYALSRQKVRILPSGTVELVINLSDDEIRIYDSQRPECCHRLPGIVVSGAYAGALDIDPMQHASMLGVHFKPGGAFRFFGAALGELANNHFPLEALWGRSAVELRERLCSAATPQKRFHILEDALKARLPSAAEHPAVLLAMNVFGPAGIGDSVRNVANRVGLSQRRFIQVFTEHIGLKPKLFCRVLRFNHALDAVDRAAALDWRQIALNCGYCDQSHLIRDFQEFCGFSPSGYFDVPANRRVRSHIRLVS